MIQERRFFSYSCTFSTTMVQSDTRAAIAPMAAHTGRSAMPTSGAAPLEVQFTNTSTGSYTDVLWSFGDVVTSTLESPIHTYTTTGNYTVTLTVSGPGVSDTLVQPSYVTVHEPVRADFTATPTAGVVPLGSLQQCLYGGLYRQPVGLWGRADGHIEGTSSHLRSIWHLHRDSDSHSGPAVLALPWLLTLATVWAAQRTRLRRALSNERRNVPKPSRHRTRGRKPSSPGNSNGPV